MCDYSLMGVPNRLAREGEDLVVHTFPTGTRGLTPDRSGSPPSVPRRPKLLASILEKLFGMLDEEEVAVCIPPGARLLLRDIPERVRNSEGVGTAEEVVFTQLSATAHEYRDAVRFANGREVLIQRLRRGQRVRVLQLALADEPVQQVSEEPEFFQITTTMRTDLIASRLIR